MPNLRYPLFFKCRLLSVFYLYYLPSLSVFEEKGSLIQTCDYWSLDLLKNTLHMQDPMQHGYGYAYRYRKDTDTRIRQFPKQPDTRIRFTIFFK